MEILLLFSFLLLYFYLLRLSKIEVLFLTLILSPIIIIGLLDFLPARMASIISFLTLPLLACLISNKKQSDKKIFRESIIFFIVAYLILYFFILRWPDFIAIGERLRDYAMISSVIYNPYRPIEPWLPFEPLNYHIYWYRFGAILASVFNLRAWSIYQQLISFSYAFYLLSLYLILRVPLKFTWHSSIFILLLIGFGSNLIGVKYAFNLVGSSWWYPTRVIEGLIWEFPSWSFILSDAHPHFLNIGSMLFLLYFLDRTFSSIQRVSFFKATEFLAIVMLGTAFFYIANSWELPIFFGIIGSIIISFLLVKIEVIKIPLTRAIQQNKTPLYFYFIKSLILIVLAMAFIKFISLFRPSSYPISLVNSSIGRTPAHLFSQHFFFPILLIITSFFINWGNNNIVKSIIAISLCCSFVLDSALYLILNLIAVIIFIAYNSYKKDKSLLTTKTLFIYVGGVFLLSALALPEIVFFNDPYGDKSERMNTIFKIYFVVWSLLYLFSFYLLRETIKNKINIKLPALLFIQGLVLVFACAFFFRVSFFERPTLRKDWPLERGLSEVGSKFKGSKDIILYLTSAKKGVVLEGAGPAYSYTSFVATLSEQFSYLGWVNHVNLLTKKYKTVERRLKVINNIYNNKKLECAKKRYILRNEGVDYLVFGTLEKERYGKDAIKGLTCLKKLKVSGEYTLFTI